MGSAIGPHPFPTIVRDFQAVIGREARAQLLEQAGQLPAVVVACVGGGSNAIGMFHAFVPDDGSNTSGGGADARRVRLVGVEAGGSGMLTAKHSPSAFRGALSHIRVGGHKTLTDPRLLRSDLSL